MRELEIRLDKPNALKFKTGQFVMIHVPGGEKPVKRAYSIASDEKIDSRFSLIMKLVPGGVCSEYIKALPEGSKMEVTGPFGKCFFKTPAPEQVVFLCTGAGLSQHFSMLLSEGPHFPNTKFHLLIGVWNEEEIFYTQELETLKKQLKNFSYEFVLDKAGPQWKGKTGYVTQFISSFDFKGKDTMFYLCGNPAMIKGVKQYLEEQGFPKEKVVAESFG